MALDSLRHLEMVHALAQHRHFSRAAKALGVSQPSLTRTLKHLEDTLGVRLFERHDGVTPTLFGRIVIERGETLLRGYSELLRELTLTKGLDIGELTVAIAPFPAEISGHKAMGMLAARYPGLQLELSTTDWTRVVDDIFQGRADLGFADISEAVEHVELETELVRASRLHFYCRTGHPLAENPRLCLEDLMEFPWVAPTGPARVRIEMPQTEKPFGVFSEINNRIRPRVVVGNVSAAKDIVIASDGLSVTLPALIERELRDGLCILLPIDLPWMRLNYGFVWKKGRTRSPAAEAFIQLVWEIEKDVPAYGSGIVVR